MRRREGFTLIELMIVIAVLGILLNSIYPGLKASIMLERHSARHIKDCSELTSLYSLIKAELPLCGNVVRADENGVEFDNGRKIKVLHGGRAVQIGSRTVSLEGGSRCWGFERVDKKAFSTQIKNGAENIRVIWLAGATHD
jgi:prepilin-type N-terminal cleavage/methylation domain-containing protein